MAILPSRLRPPPPAGGSSWVRSGSVLSSASISQDKGARCGSTIARRSLPASIHAVRYEPRPSRRCSCRADRPLLWVATRKAARNQVVSASLLSCRIVPARTEVWRAALGALEGVGQGLAPPGPDRAADRAHEAIRPALLDQIRRA